MNQHVRVVAAAGVAWICALMAAPAGAAPEAAAPAKPAVTLPLTDAEIAGLRFQVEEDGKKLELLAKFEAQKLDEREAKRAARSGKIPFIITGSFTEIREVKGKYVTTPKPDSVNILVLDAANNIIAKRSMPAGRLTAMRDGSGGFSDVAPTSGTYRAIVWTDHKKAGKIGQVLTTKLQLP